MKEVFFPISETLFYFTENTVTESEPRIKKDALVFLRSCDLHSVKRLDAIYLENKFADPYYKRLREKMKFILIGCPTAYDNCFCVDMKPTKATIMRHPLIATAISFTWMFETKPSMLFLNATVRKISP